MASNSNNPITNIISDVLGINSGKFASYKAKVDALNNRIAKANPLIQELPNKATGKKLKLDRPLVTFDLETTGLVAGKDEIFEMHFVKLDPSGKITKFSEKLRPSVPISPEAAKKTGVTQAILNTYTNTFEDVAPKLASFLEGTDLAGYNISGFDIPFLSAQFKKAGIASPIVGSQLVDVFSLAKARYAGTSYSGGFSLGEMHQQILGRPLVNAHSAQADVMATTKILRKMLVTTNLPTDVSGLAKVAAYSRVGSLSGIKNVSDLLRMDKFTMLQGTTQFTGAGIENLAQELVEQGRLPVQAMHVFGQIRQGGGTIYFNKDTSALYFGSNVEDITKYGTQVTALPIRTGPKGSSMVQIGTSSRSSRGALILGSSEKDVIFKGSFIDLFYGEFSSKAVNTNLGFLAGQAKATFNQSYTSLGKMRSLLGSGFTDRGINTAFEQSRAMANEFVVGYSNVDFALNPLYKATMQYKAANAGLAMLLTTGGRMVFPELGLPQGANYKEALTAISGYRESFFTTLKSTLSGLGILDTLPYTKPDTIIGKKMVVGDVKEAMFLGRMFGTSFEESALKKGLFQARKIARTTNLQAAAMVKAGLNPYAPFVLSDAPDINFGKLSRVAVVQTQSALESMTYFGESGTYYTNTGALSLRNVYPKGTLNLKNPMGGTIEAVERLFGVNFGAGYSQSLSSPVTFTQQDIADALRRGKGGIRFKDLSQNAQDIRTILYSNRGALGLLKQIARGEGDPLRARVAKVNLTASNLKIDLLTGKAMVPNNVEMLMSLRRVTASRMQAGNPFAAIAKDIDFVMASDEFFKTHGPLAFVSNYIGNILERGNEFAAAEFKETFGFDPIATSRSGKTYLSAQIGDNMDAALEKVIARVNTFEQKDPKLYDAILRGKVMASNIPGVKEIRSFFLFSAARTDFMSDINMLKPIKMTLAKMVSLGNAGAQLGYQMGEDPLFQIFKGLSNPWKRGHLQLSQKYGQLMLGENHWLREFSKALATPETVGDINKKNIIRVGQDGGFVRIGKDGKEVKLKSLPKDIAQFKYRNGGVPMAELKDTILDPSLLDNDIMYIDLGKNVRMNLLGSAGASKEYRYLPLPMKALRVKGVQGVLTLSEKSTEYGIIQDLTELEKGGAATAKGINYSKIFRSIIGKEGILNTTSKSVISFGTRVRLAPALTNMLNYQDLLNPEKLFEAHVLKSELYDFLGRKEAAYVRTKKGGVSKTLHNTVLEATREAADQGFFYAAIGVDPTQRAEHLNIHKVLIVDDNTQLGKHLLKNRKIGQLGLALNPLLTRMLERDLDKDVANLTPLEGLSLEGKTPAQTRELLKIRYEKQTALMKHFQFFYYMQLKAEESKTVAQRLEGIIMNKLKKAGDYISEFLGVPKSLGYSITRGSESVIAALVDNGMQGATDLGLLERGFTEDSITKALAPYADAAGSTSGAVRLSVARKLLQNVYQGAVQKGSTKDALIALSETLLDIGQKYKGKNYDVVKAREESTNAFRTFLTGEKLDIAAKNRMLSTMDYFVDTGAIDKTSVEALKADLLKENGAMMSEATRSKFASLFKQAIEAQSTLLGEFFGAAMPIAASVRKSYRGAIGIVQKRLRKNIEDKEVIEAVLSGSLGKPTPVDSGDFKGTLADDMAKALATAKGEGNGLLSRARKYFDTGGGKFVAGLGVGALATAAIASMVSGPEPMSPPPMPRDIDGRQPMDVGPEIMASAPKIYGNNQVFAASRNRSPETFSAAPRYNFGAGNDVRMTMRDKTSPINPYLLEQQMSRVANRDFNY